MPEHTLWPQTPPPPASGEEAAIDLLRQLISIPSFSREEDGTAGAIGKFLLEAGVQAQRLKNNVWARNRHYNPELPTILLNSHHDTVRPNPGYTLDPFMPLERDGKLFGLGSNDAGGALVSLIATFLHFHHLPDLKYNLILAATAEEEISGEDGIALVLPELGPVDFAIVGEPTQMHLAIAEKGLMVLDCVAHGTGAHAARDEGDNAIYKALADIQWFCTYRFAQVSPTLGPVKMTVTIINAGSQHNVVPDRCAFTVDVRTTDVCDNHHVLQTVRTHVGSQVTPRSMRLNPSSISADHPFVRAGIALGRTTYGSPTVSDQARMDFPSVKLGPGDSARSHTSDEFIYLDEIRQGIRLYQQMLSHIIIDQ